MANEFLEWVAGSRKGTGSGSSDGGKGNGYALSPGIVSNNVDLLGLGRVQVRIPALPAFEPWARLSAIGAGSSRGFLWVPEIDDEVLVAFSQNDERDAYILGGLWSTMAMPPLDLFSDFVIKRVIKTGKTAGVGHEILFDDAQQSITITSSTDQKITIDPTKIELASTGDSVVIKMDLTSQTISITAPLKIELQATQISLQGTQIDIKGATINLQATGPCAIQGLPVKIN
ncbi:MAG TPA: phage baseplate assembly protein V [Pyrinomonadaceae bacterium]|jgi:uncharacterized protein involved in type VI secretion and phage assembly|nr:phage baseplate assembly protein V [Pyrinomonadaceae bacterium]